MKALVYYGQRDIRLEEVAIPEPGAGEILLRVTRAGICQTQINEFMEGPFIINAEPHPLTGKAVPFIVGHEFGGVVEHVGEGVPADRVGQQMAVLPLLTCGECTYCRQGQENLCDQLAYYGLLGENGGFAEYTVVRQENIFPVDDPALLTFIEPLLVGIHAGQRVGAETLAGKKVLVLGAGTLGLALAAVWQYYYHAEVYLNDILPFRLAKAGKAGFRTLEKGSIPSDFNLVVDCAGSDPLSPQAALLEGFDYLLKGGTLVNVGTYFHPLSLVPTALMLVPEKAIVPSFAYSIQDLPHLEAALQSIRPVDFSLFIDTVPLDKIIEAGYFRAEVGRDSYVRLVVKC